MDFEILKQIFIVIGAWITAILTYKLTSKNDKSKIVSTQFKQVGIDKQKELLELWEICTSSNYEKFIDKIREKYNENKIDEKEILRIYTNDVLLFASKETMRMFAIFMQNAYKSAKKEKEKKVNKQQKQNFRETKNKLDSEVENVVKKVDMKVIYLGFKVMSSMKFDYTGEKVKTLDLIKINDLNFKRIIQIKWYEIYYSNLISKLRFWN